MNVAHEDKDSGNLSVSIGVGGSSGNNVLSVSGVFPPNVMALNVLPSSVVCANPPHGRSAGTGVVGPSKT